MGGFGVRGHKVRVYPYVVDNVVNVVPGHVIIFKHRIKVAVYPVMNFVKKDKKQFFLWRKKCVYNSFT